MTAQKAIGRILDNGTPTGDEALLTECMPLLREYGLDLHSFHLEPLRIDISPFAMKLVKPLFDIRQAGVGLQFFPCKLEVMGMPFFCYLWVSDNPKVLRVIAPRLRSLTDGTEVSVEVESSRALFV